MTIDEYEPEKDLMEISRKLSSVALHRMPSDGEHISKDSLPTLKYLLLSNEPEEIKRSARLLRKYLAITSKDESCVNDIIKLDILPRLKYLIEHEPCEDIKFECSWIVTNIAAGAGYQTSVIYKEGFGDLLLRCVRDKDLKYEVKVQAAWALGNIAGDDKPKYREELLKNGLTDAISELLEERYQLVMNRKMYRDLGNGIYLINSTTEQSSIATLIWVLTNMSRGGFHVAEWYSKYATMFSELNKFIIFDNIDIQDQLYHAFYRILFNMHEVDQFYNLGLITPILCERLGVVLRDGNSKILWGALKTTINISSSPDKITVILKDVDILSYMSRVLSPSTPQDFKVDSFLVVSNLSVGNEEMVQYVISHKLVMSNIIAHICVPGYVYSTNSYEWIRSLQITEDDTIDWRVTKEAVLAVFNLIASGSDASIWELMKDHPILLQSLGYVLFFPGLPSIICEKVINTMIALIQRSNKWVDTRFTEIKNPYVQQYINDGIVKLIPYIQKRPFYPSHIKDLCSKLDKLLVISEHSVGKATSISDTPDLASAFGLATLEEIKSKSSKRRIIRGFEDGDVRLIENAVGNLCI